MATHLAISPARFEAECRAIYHDVEAITNGLSKAQFNWQPDGGRRWSIAQCLDHLTKGNEVYLAPLERAIDRATPRQGREPGVPNGFARWFIGQLEPPVRTRRKAPSKIVPRTDLDPAATRQAFDDSVDRVKALLDRAWTVELSRTRFRNPFIHLPVFNVASAFLISLAHMRRHVAQAGAVRHHPDFPAGDARG